MAETSMNEQIAIDASDKVERPAGFWQAMGRRMRRDPVSLTCAAILAIILLVAVLAPWIAPHDPYQTSVLNRLKPPGAAPHWLGTDELGRDLLSRLIYGARLSLFMGFMPVILATLIGGALGVTAGYFRGVANIVSTAE